MSTDPGPYTTPEQVRQIDPSIPLGEDLTIYIRSAHVLVWNSIVSSGCGANYSTDHLALIEAWLTAHFRLIQSGIINSESAGGASESYTIHQDTFLMNTMFGQQAMLLDTNSCLASLMGDIEDAKTGKKKKRVGLFWLGSPQNPVKYH
jgi:hypothetical protein